MGDVIDGWTVVPVAGVSDARRWFDTSRVCRSEVSSFPGELLGKWREAAAKASYLAAVDLQGSSNAGF